MIKTEKPLDNGKRVKCLAWLCALVYTGSYITRLNFAATTVGIIRDTGWAKSSIAIVTTGMFISYGIGQLISGWIADRTKPFGMITVGMAGSVMMNLLIPSCGKIPVMTIIWCVNGLFQSLIWVPIVKILVANCDGRDYDRSMMIVSWACPTATFSVYLISSFFAEFSVWSGVFYLSAAIAAITLVVWILLYHKFAIDIDESSVKNASVTDNDLSLQIPEKSKMPEIMFFVLIPVLLATALMGALRDSISTWLPNYILEIFSLKESASILSGAVVPLFTAAMYPLTLGFYHKFFKSELSCSACIYGLATSAAAILFFTYDKSPILATILLSAISSSMNAIDFLIIGLFPKNFQQYGHVGVISGLLDCTVYAGSAISIWGIAGIAENKGWQFTSAFWGFMALSGAVLLLWAARLLAIKKRGEKKPVKAASSAKL